MQKELEQRLVERWPGWFNVEGDPRQTGMAAGFRHGHGWFEILWRLCEELEPLVRQFEEQTGQRFEVLQVKEKLGGLRFYVNHPIDAISERVEAALLESLGVKSAVSRVSVGKPVGFGCCAKSTAEFAPNKGNVGGDI